MNRLAHVVYTRNILFHAVMRLQLCIAAGLVCKMSAFILSQLGMSLSLSFRPYDYIEMGMNGWGEDVIMHTGLRAIDITRLDDYAAVENRSSTSSEDPFADLVVDPPELLRRSGRQRTKRREAGDGKGPLVKPQKQQACSV